MSEANGTHAGVKRKVLSRKEAFDLMTWVSTQRDHVANTKMTTRQVTEEAVKALGIPELKKTHIIAAFHDLGIPLPRTGRGRPSGGNYVAAVRARVEQLEVRVEQLEGRLAEETRLRKLAEARLAALEKDVAPFSVTKPAAAGKGV